MTIAHAPRSSHEPTPPRIGRPPRDHRVTLVHRAGAVIVAAVIAPFGVLGYLGGLSAFDTQGVPLLGLSTNGLLSTVSVVTALVLVAAAVRGGRPASTTMILVGSAFLVAAFVGLALLSTPYNLLAFRLPNVFFSIAAGLVLLTVGSHGRLTIHPPEDNPYRASGDPLLTAFDARFASESTLSVLPRDHQPRPLTRADARADREMADAFRARAAGAAAEVTSRRLLELDRLTTHESRRAAWMASQERV